jgi:hypothetical protein
MCQCFQIGGPFIAEDPDCPAHGWQAQSRDSEIQALRTRLHSADSIEELRSLMLELIDLI